ncbi:SAM-dependent chlorinase/fluorinase [uncultured Roseivirga sp.]|uniref:SAM hydrolase/SAM-dependent halogenase family protein n=2 Tax=uncultured Roseivirga sp. TaxID=543088 RepID=UPI0030D82C05|tara:strand:+ start:221012 stop:221779 length:768 start_codon:yes stop_codon:yes gene_type:complete
MAIVTLTSDFGHTDHYVAALKASLISKDNALKLIDISHDIEPFDIAHMAFVVSAVFRDFPKGTIHMLSTNVAQANQDSYLAAKIEDHFFVAPDNGILSLISDKTPEAIVKLSIDDHSTFPQRGVLADFVLRLATNEDVSNLGEAVTAYTQLMLRKPRATKKEISGHVIRVDRYGNLITNISKVDFDILSKNRNYKLVFGRESAPSIHSQYYDVDPGEVFFVFNSLNVLEIGINQGNASTLLGLSYDSPILIQFEE